jgi:hypothetical protein
MTNHTITQKYNIIKERQFRVSRGKYYIEGNIISQMMFLSNDTELIIYELNINEYHPKMFGLLDKYL